MNYFFLLSHIIPPPFLIDTKQRHVYISHEFAGAADCATPRCSNYPVLEYNSPVVSHIPRGINSGRVSKNQLPLLPL